MDYKPEDYWQWLSRVDGVGIKIKLMTTEYFGGAEEVFRASRDELKWTGFLNEQLIHKIISNQDNKLLDEYIKQLEKTNIRFIPMCSEEYPELLKKISDPPLGLYVLGTLPEHDLCQVSIIGSRKCSEYGLSVAYRFGNELARVGIVIVSGMARGVDSMAHRGALDSEGLTVAVLGCGLDICYPPENRVLMRKISERGCVVSEYPPGTRPMAGNFPARNRIISGMSSATVVVEASRKSGTLITVDQALNEGREVMVVPGNITSPLSEGTNNLIRQGATPVTSSVDILEHLGISLLTSEEDSKTILAPMEELVYDCIRFEPIAVESVYEQLGKPPGDVNYILALLEIRKLIRRLPGQRVVRI